MEKNSVVSKTEEPESEWERLAAQYDEKYDSDSTYEDMLEQNTKKISKSIKRRFRKGY